ncbi:MAG: CPBP family intramembrane metalloprotease [Alphaproteobacteria bacterium]|nr:CPBP family intramembrane metalloprotease [Alphaproteobacteria bacterium]
MTRYKYLVERYPLITSFMLIALCLAIVLGLPQLFPKGTAGQDLAKILLRFAVGFGALYLLVKFNWASAAGIAGKPWHKRWWLATLPMSLLAGVNLLGTNWEAVVLGPAAVFNWLGYNLSVGLFEEALLRGLCFYILYNGWKHKKNGLLAAAVVQAVIFGLLHLINLAHAPVLDTVSQTIYATLLGIGFAGLAAYCRSIWPGVALHAFINLAGSINTDLIPGNPQAAGTLEMYIGAAIVITIVSTLPGLWQLRKAQQAAAA